MKRALRLIRRNAPRQLSFWFIALMIGIAAGFAALLFRKAIYALQTFLYGTSDVSMASVAQGLPWWWILVLPIFGGLIVGIILDRFTEDGRVRSVADVIEGASMQNGRVEMRAGLASAAASLITLSSGGSSGREGPVVHLAGVISTWVCRRMHADGITGRDLLGCAVAAAVSASFNAPIAGALFALEVVLRHFAVHAFAPIAIASVAGTVISRLEYGDVHEFELTDVAALDFYVELPAFLILGLICGLVAAALMWSVFLTEDAVSKVQARLSMPRFLRPALAGALLGTIAIGFPHIIGVGYETTLRALSSDLLLREAIVFAIIKTIAVTITLAGRMGGGIFSPSLMIGALTGLSFGIIATGIFPEVSGNESIYALAGMGAVAAAVLGAPISTTLIVFELTGDWETGIAVMTAVSLSSALASSLVNRSFFLTQLERRGQHLAAGPQAYVLALQRVSSVMRSLAHPKAPPRSELEELYNQGFRIDRMTTLEEAMPLFDKGKREFLAVTSKAQGAESAELVGALHYVDALEAYNHALAATAAEEHS
ncbi:MAG: chloride channel protein [Pseudomonadota bacterium]